MQNKKAAKKHIRCNIRSIKKRNKRLFKGVDKKSIIWYNKNMRKAKEIAGRKCPVCGRTENQVNAGKNRSGTQRCFCKECKKYYTHEPKTREYPEEIRQQAIKTYYAGASGRGVGKMFGFSKANVYNWIKKTGSKPEK